MIPYIYPILRHCHKIHQRWILEFKKTERSQKITLQFSNTIYDLFNIYHLLVEITNTYTS